MFYYLILILFPTCSFSSTTITTTTCFVSTSSLANNPMTLVFHPIDFKYGLQLIEQILLCLGRNQLVILGLQVYGIVWNQDSPLRHKWHLQTYFGPNVVVTFYFILVCYPLLLQTTIAATIQRFMSMVPHTPPPP